MSGGISGDGRRSNRDADYRTACSRHHYPCPLAGNLSDNEDSLSSRVQYPHCCNRGIGVQSLHGRCLSIWGVKFTFALQLRDLLLIIFFTTIGLSAKFKLLLQGGLTLGILLVLASVFLLLQDFAGVCLAKLFGAHPRSGCWVEAHPLQVVMVPLSLMGRSSRTILVSKRRARSESPVLLLASF